MTDRKAVKWLLKTAGRYRLYIAFLLLLQVAVSGASVCYALAMKNMIDCAVSGDRSGFFSGLLLFASLIAALILLRVAIRHLEEAARSSLENSFKQRLFSCLLKKDFGQVSAVHSEEWMNRLTSDTVVCANGLTEILPGFMGMAVKLAGAMALIFLLQPTLACIMLPFGILFLFIAFFLRRAIKRFHKQVQEKDGEVRVYLQERISSMLVLRTFGAEKRAESGAEKVFGGHKKARMKKAVVSNLCNTGFSAAINAMYLLGIGYCGYGILNGTVSYGTLTAIIQLVGQLQAPLSGISGYVPRFYAMLASAERLMEAEDFKSSGAEEAKAPDKAKELYNNSVKAIAFENVSFDYGKNENMPVLSNISLSVNKGDYVAVTGISGCGKSTLLKLLMGVYQPTEGRAEILLENGEKLPAETMRRLFGYVPQGNYLMGGSIREVITFGNEEGGVGIGFEKAVELACAGFIYDLPEKENTVLGEKGAGLSEGQMQRIAIARALYADAPVLILDEATSALDGETEERLLINLKQLTDKTVFIVTHRPGALQICNRQLDFSEDGMKLITLREAENE